ncbi:unnamed protein product [Phytophthora fragariaefolia]|uniref:Unnamed protein product n=1 Tax=Phytophthora fragariaefolia TaxID=1490495 RepID=A0A9W7D6Y1_9STRA|nr:unnamed protein product [Phytophthora fragariaefolia]
MKEQREVAARATVSTPSTPHVESLKLHVNSYVGREGEPLLRWLVEVDTAITARRIVDTAITARRIVDSLSKVAFAMSCLGERARSWAYERRHTDPTCFSTYEVFKEELRQAFEPPQNEFRSRAEFLDICNKVSMTCMLTLKERVKKLRQPAGAGPLAGDAVERVDIGHAVSKAAAPGERHAHCKKKDDKPNLVILKVNSKRESSLRAL